MDKKQVKQIVYNHLKDDYYKILIFLIMRLWIYGMHKDLYYRSSTNDDAFM